MTGSNTTSRAWEENATTTKETTTSNNEDPIPLSLMKNLRRKSAIEGETGSSNSENNSDNSALVSLGNTSFGFNFDSEEGANGNSMNDNSSDSDGNRPIAKKRSPAETAPGRQSLLHQITTSSGSDGKSSAASSSFTHTTTINDSSLAHRTAAENAEAGLKSIADHVASQLQLNKAQLKRKSRSDNDSGGYNSDDDDEISGEKRRGRSIGGGDAGSVSAFGGNSSVADSRASNEGKPRKKKKLDEKKREERNMREKERSFRISKQINELRALLSQGGVIVPKGTKSSVLTEAANYIRMLQQHQYRSEIDRHQLVQQMQLIGGGAHGQEAANAIRHVAAQNGVWSLGNFGGVPPKSAMTFYQPSSNDKPQQTSSSSDDILEAPKIETPDYRFVFNSCGVGMAVASMGGAFIDCNQLFCRLSNYSKQEICSLTIFNLTSRQDLQPAFDLISQMISPPLDSDHPKPIVLRGSMKRRDDLGLCISLVKGEDGIAKCFCVTLIKNPTSPYDTSKPVPVSFESILEDTTIESQSPKEPETLEASPAFTTG